jgi:transcriptional regulator with XRE-family HTH domain
MESADRESENDTAWNEMLTDALVASGAKLITVNQVVAWNIAWYRRAAGMRQRDLASRLGWPQNRVSEAERSWDGKRTREFDAQLLAELAVALGVPLIALFLPPDGPGLPHLFSAHGGRDLLGMDDLMRLVMPDPGVDTPVVNAYRRRFQAAATRHVDEDWAEEVGAWLREAEGAEARAEARSRFLSHVASLLNVVDELRRLAEVIGPGDDEEEEGQ